MKWEFSYIWLSVFSSSHISCLAEFDSCIIHNNSTGCFSSNVIYWNLGDFWTHFMASSVVASENVWVGPSPICRTLAQRVWSKKWSFRQLCSPNTSTGLNKGRAKRIHFNFTDPFTNTRVTNFSSSYVRVFFNIPPSNGKIQSPVGMSNVYNDIIIFISVST